MVIAVPVKKELRLKSEAAPSAQKTGAASGWIGLFQGEALSSCSCNEAVIQPERGAVIQYAARIGRSPASLLVLTRPENPDWSVFNRRNLPNGVVRRGESNCLSFSLGGESNGLCACLKLSFNLENVVSKIG